MEAIKVWFPINNIYTDTLFNICGAIYSSIPVYPLPASMSPYFWIEYDTNGQPKLCTFKVDESLALPGTGLQATFTDPVSGNYNITAKTFSAVQIGSTITFKPQ